MNGPLAAGLGRGRNLLVALALVALALPAKAEVTIDLTNPNVQPLPIAVTDFYGARAEDAAKGGDVAGVVTADLERSGLFQPLPKGSFIQSPEQLLSQPRFADWRLINAQVLVSGTAETQPDGRLKVEFRLWDVFAGQQLAGLAYFTTPENWRRVAHIVADAIYKRLTGEEGYFDSRLVYVSESGPKDRRVKRLAIMDQDGANHRFLTDGANLVLTPRFSPSTQEITYLSYVGTRPRVYIFNIDTGQQEVIGDFPGMTFAPRFSPDGNAVVLSQATSGNTDIFKMDLRTRRVTRITTDPSIDTSPSFSPDGTQIVFNSDRGGSQQLYIVSANGGEPRRISFGQGRYATPVWSPRGDLIAFTQIEGGAFSIGVMRPDGSGERLLSRGYLVEGPTWAPNGRVLAFFRQDGARSAPRLYTIDLTGANERPVKTPQDASDPAWSPLIP